jgi:hypothetical protein
MDPNLIPAVIITAVLFCLHFRAVAAARRAGFDPRGAAQRARGATRAWHTRRKPGGTASRRYRSKG